jgi:O-acetyl-ADP-ribose deacetylase (regulator of RNase III)
MNVIIKVGDILDEAVDVLISSANVHLNLSGGVNGAILQRGGITIQTELHDYLKQLGKSWVPPGTVVRTGPGPLAVKHVLHAVAVDAFYGTSVELVTETLRAALVESPSLVLRPSPCPRWRPATAAYQSKTLQRRSGT